MQQTYSSPPTRLRTVYMFVPSHTRCILSPRCRTLGHYLLQQKRSCFSFKIIHGNKTYLIGQWLTRMSRFTSSTPNSKNVILGVWYRIAVWRERQTFQ